MTLNGYFMSNSVFSIFAPSILLTAKTNEDRCTL